MNKNPDNPKLIGPYICTETHKLYFCTDEEAQLKETGAESVNTNRKRWKRCLYVYDFFYYTTVLFELLRLL